MRLACLILVIFASMAASCLPGAAQSLTCRNFVRNPNGSWSPVRKISIRKITIGPGVQFTPGVYFGGIDLAALLNRRCR